MHKSDALCLWLIRAWAVSDVIELQSLDYPIYFMLFDIIRVVRHSILVVVAIAFLLKSVL